MFVHPTRHQKILLCNHIKAILNETLTLAQLHTTIPNKDLRTIKHCRKSLLFFEDESLTKKATGNSFDVTMGSYDSAEICKIMGLLLFNNFPFLSTNETWVFTETIVWSFYPTWEKEVRTKWERKSQKLSSRLDFKSKSLQVSNQLDFLDMTLNLNTSTYQTYLMIRVMSTHIIKSPEADFKTTSCFHNGAPF